jgi:hypothetical protein
MCLFSANKERKEFHPEMAYQTTYVVAEISSGTLFTEAERGQENLALVCMRSPVWIEYTGFEQFCHSRAWGERPTLQGAFPLGVTSN